MPRFGVPVDRDSIKRHIVNLVKKRLFIFEGFTVR